MAEGEKMLFALDQKQRCKGFGNHHLPNLRRVEFAAVQKIQINIWTRLIIRRTLHTQERVKKPTVKQDESRNVSGKGTGLVLMFLRSPMFGGLIPMLFISPPQHDTSCCAELNWRYEGLLLILISNGIPMFGKLWAQEGNTCGNPIKVMSLTITRVLIQVLNSFFCCYSSNIIRPRL